MTDVKLVDVSLRDGNQSLWGAVGVTSRMMEGAAPLLDAVGYHAIELLSSTMIAVAVRFHKEDPWERLRAARAGTPNTPLGFLTTGKRFITFYRTPDAVFELAFDLLARNGVTRLWVIDPMHDMAGAKRTAELAKKAGFTDVVGGICYTTSPVHTDEHYAERIAQLDDCPAIDSVYLKDPAGLLTPERLLSLQPRLQGALSRLRLNEIHSHSTTGLSPLTLLTAADLGMEILHCALPPLANGGSHPSAPRLVHNLRARGHRVDVDVDALHAASAYLDRQATIKKLPKGVPAEYDEAYKRHTIPGGVQTTTARQLREMGRPELFDAVIEEAVQVRSDLGWPIVMTPFAQYIVTQATLNVITGERYKQISDEIIDLLRGDFGPLPGPVDQNLLDRALSHPERSAASRDQDITVAGLRKRFGKSLSDEELLLRAVMPAEQVDAMVANRNQSAAAQLRTLLDAADRSGRATTFQFSNSEVSFRLDRAAASKPGGAA
ncbi:MAG TPA: hypothetical protein VFO01_01985 [Trebonia sp.]|nr:hypothetical protein [Trebonia sp.]